jgi:Fic-DOC domain mobile mystery protein B
MRFEYAPGATPIDLDEAKGLIPVHLTLQRELNEYEETNILEAIEWLLARRRGDPLDERFIHIVHGRMFNQTWKWAGKSRRTDKNMGVSWFEIPVQLRQMLGDVRAQIEHQAYSPVEIAARFEWGRGSLVAANELRARYIAALQAADAGDCQPLLVFLDSA